MKLKDWRKAQGLTMAGAGEKLGLSQPSMSRIEAGKQWPDRPTMERIFSVTGGQVTAEDFVNLPEADAAPQQGRAA